MKRFTDWVAKILYRKKDSQTCWGGTDGGSGGICGLNLVHTIYVQFFINLRGTIS